MLKHSTTIICILAVTFFMTTSFRSFAYDPDYEATFSLIASKSLQEQGITVSSFKAVNKMDPEVAGIAVNFDLTKPVSKTVALVGFNKQGEKIAQSKPENLHAGSGPCTVIFSFARVALVDSIVTMEVIEPSDNHQ